MTCKDCIHYEVCGNKLETKEQSRHNDNYICCNFKNKFLFIVLPCKVGDIVYIITECSCEDIDGVHTECEFYGYGTDDRICTIPNGAKCPYQYRVVECVATDMNILAFARRLSKTVFLTKEEAEKALKEREQNE